MNQVPEKLLNKNFLLTSVCQICFSLSLCLTMPTLPLYLTMELGASKSYAGTLVGLYALAALAARPVAGPVVDRNQRRPVFTIFAVSYVLISAGYIFFTDLALLGLIRILHGFAFGIAGTALITIAVDNMPPARLGSGVGLFGVIMSMGIALGPALGMLIKSMYSHQATFIASTLLGVVCLLASRFISMPKRLIPPASGPLINPKRLILPKSGLAVLTAALVAYCYGMNLNFLSLLAADKGLESSSGPFFTFLAAGLMLSRFFSGRLLDKGMLLQLIIAGKLMVIITTILFLQASTPTTFCLAGMAMGIGFGATSPSYQTLFISMTDRHHVGTANSTYQISWDAGISVSGLIGGVIADATSMSSSFFIGVVMVAISLVIFMLTTTRSYKSRKA